jgi:hypothetical protein
MVLMRTMKNKVTPNSQLKLGVRRATHAKYAGIAAEHRWTLAETADVLADFFLSSRGFRGSKRLAGTQGKDAGSLRSASSLTSKL